jgi:hypothetical protein
MKQLVFSVTLIFCATITNAQVTKQKPVTNFNVDSLNKANRSYISENLKNIDTVALKNKITGIKKETGTTYSDSDLDEIIEQIKKYKSVNVDNKFSIKRSTVDNMPIVITTKSGLICTIQVFNTIPKPGESIPK